MHTVQCEFGSSSDDVYSIQHYEIKFVSDVRQVGGFLRIPRFPPPIKLTARIYIAEILFKVALNNISLTLYILYTYVI